uniref:Uncharacterized protein n=1 Tax=viral metagenome TaxID=1070528 RepID=A0A6M3INN7_9ZZZZ
MGNVGSLGIIKDAETFFTENIASSAADGVKWLSAGDSGDAMFAIASSAARGIHAVGSLAATANNLLEFTHSGIVHYVQVGYNAFEIVFEISDATYVAINFGFNDDELEAATTLPVELSGTTFTANATSFCGLVFDTDADNDDWHCFWVDDSSATSTAIANLRMSGMSLKADTMYKLRVELQDAGSGNGARATFTVSEESGKSASKEFSTTLDRDVALCYYFGIEQRTSASAKSIYIWAPLIETSLAP